MRQRARNDRKKAQPKTSQCAYNYDQRVDLFSAPPSPLNGHHLAAVRRCLFFVQIYNFQFFEIPSHGVWPSNPRESRADVATEKTQKTLLSGIESFDATKLKHAETEEKNVLPDQKGTDDRRSSQTTH